MYENYCSFSFWYRGRGTLKGGLECIRLATKYETDHPNLSGGLGCSSSIRLDLVFSS